MAGKLKLNTLLEKISNNLSKAKKEYEENFNNLVARMNEKMQSFAISHHDLELSHEQLLDKVKVLQSNFDAKVEEVQNLIEKIESFESSSDQKMREVITELEKLKDNLSQKSLEASELSKKLEQEKNNSTMSVAELSGFVIKLHSYYKLASQQFAELAESASEFNKQNYISNSNYSYDKSDGEFDLLEHLSKSIKKSKTKKIWGDW